MFGWFSSHLLNLRQRTPLQVAQKKTASGLRADSKFFKFFTTRTSLAIPQEAWEFGATLDRIDYLNANFQWGNIMSSPISSRGQVTPFIRWFIITFPFNRLSPRYFPPPGMARGVFFFTIGWEEAWNSLKFWVVVSTHLSLSRSW